VDQGLRIGLWEIGWKVVVEVQEGSSDDGVPLVDLSLALEVANGLGTDLAWADQVAGSYVEQSASESEAVEPGWAAVVGFRMSERERERPGRAIGRTGTGGARGGRAADIAMDLGEIQMAQPLEVGLIEVIR
jgi:hypothetical protein